MSVNKSAASTLFKSAKAFEAWLKRHHATSPGLWLKIAKRHADVPSVTYLDAAEIALCWGWIDGQKKSLNEQYFLQRFTPAWTESSAADFDAVVDVVRSSLTNRCGRLYSDYAES